MIEKEETREFAAAAPSSGVHPMRMGVTKWLVDTGCAYNLIEKRCVDLGGVTEKVNRRKDPLRSNTANGPVITGDIIDIQCPQLEEGGFVASVLPSTPPCCRWVIGA